MTSPCATVREVSLHIDPGFWRGQRAFAFAYLQSHRPGFRERAGHLLGHVVWSCVRAIGPTMPSILGERVDHLLLRGISQDRVKELAGEYARANLAPALHESDCIAWRSAREAGFKIRLISSLIEEFLTALCQARGLIIDELQCNRLEYRDHIATGRLLFPMVSAPHSSGHSKSGRKIYLRNLGGNP